MSIHCLWFTIVKEIAIQNLWSKVCDITIQHIMIGPSQCIKLFLHESFALLLVTNVDDEYLYLFHIFVWITSYKSTKKYRYKQF